MEFKTSVPFLVAAGTGNASAYLLAACVLLFLAGCIQGATFSILFRVVVTSVVAHLKAAYRAAALLRRWVTRPRD